MSNNNNNPNDNEGNNSLNNLFRAGYQDPKSIYIQQSQPILSAQAIPAQQYQYQTSNTPSHSIATSIPHQIQNILAVPPIQPQNLYIYDNGSQPIPSQSSIKYPPFQNTLNDGEKLNQNNYQLRKLKKARLKRQKKAEYIDFLEQRISQLDRIIKQHNLIFVEPPADDENKAQPSNTNVDATVSTPTPVHTPNSENAYSPVDNEDDNLKRKSLVDELEIPNSLKKLKNELLEKSKEGTSTKPNNLNENKKNDKNNNKFSFDNYRLDSSILLQNHYLDTEISLDLSRGLFEMADEFLNFPDEISCDFYEIDKQEIDFKNDSLDVFHRSNYSNQKPIPNKTKLHINMKDPYGIFSGSFCTFHNLYKNLSETENFNEFVAEIIQTLFVYCSYFPPDDLVDMHLLKKDISTHNLFMIYSLCSYGLVLIPFDMPYNIRNCHTFINNCIKACPSDSIEDFYFKYIKNKQITYKPIIALAELFYREALKYHFFDGPIELHTIEGYVSLCLYKCLIGDPYKGWEYLAMAIRYGDAFNLNSYIDGDNNYDIEKIISKRLWWKCYVYDVMSVKLIDVVPFFNNTRFDKFTRDRIDYYNDPQINKSSDLSKAEKTSNFFILHRMARVWKKSTFYVNDQLNRRLNRNYFYSLDFAKPGYSLFKKVEDTTNNNNDDDNVTPVLDPTQELLKLEIKNLWDSIPEIFKRVSMVNSSMNPNILKLMATFHLIYYSITICIYRPPIIHKDFKWSKGYWKNSYNRIVCLQSAQRIARFVYYYMKNGMMDLIPNASLYPIFEAVFVLFCDHKANENVSKKRPIKTNYEEKKKKLLILNIIIIFYYHRAKHQMIANLLLKFILDYTKENNIPTILHEVN